MMSPLHLSLVLSLLATCSSGRLLRRRGTAATRQENEYCAITEDSFSVEYSALTNNMGIYDPETGQSCSLYDLMNGQWPAGREFAGRTVRDVGDYQVCETLFNFSQRLLVGLNTTSLCCLTNSSECRHNISIDEMMDITKAYGYGTLMVVLLSLLSLLGVFIVPLVKHHDRCGTVYEYVNLFLISLGTSALFSDAILHLIPRVFLQLLEEELERGEEAGVWDERDLAIACLWRVCAVMGGVYFFYLFEMFLHKVTKHSHQPEETTEETGDNVGNGDIRQEIPHPSQRLIIPRDSRVSFGHTSLSLEHSDLRYNTFHSKYKLFRRRCKFGCKCDVQPLAVLVIVGDAFHNFTDGLALGAAISQNLALGVSTIIALVFHEIPHELGDYAILLSTGMRWYIALLFNFLSSLTALAGFFIGVSVGLLSQQANAWMLAVAAGTFFYVSLVDLLPLIIHSKLKGFLAVLLSNLGFSISFCILLLVALYEDKFDDLV